MEPENTKPKGVFIPVTVGEPVWYKDPEAEAPEKYIVESIEITKSGIKYKAIRRPEDLWLRATAITFEPEDIGKEIILTGGDDNECSG